MQHKNTQGATCNRDGACSRHINGNVVWRGLSVQLPTTPTIRHHAVPCCCSMFGTGPLFCGPTGAAAGLSLRGRCSRTFLRSSIVWFQSSVSGCSAQNLLQQPSGVHAPVHSQRWDDAAQLGHLTSPTRHAIHGRVCTRPGIPCGIVVARSPRTSDPRRRLLASPPSQTWTASHATRAAEAARTRECRRQACWTCMRHRGSDGGRSGFSRHICRGDNFRWG
jgi:hypothetical protein